jgi:hypothetical protein
LLSNLENSENKINLEGIEKLSDKKNEIKNDVTKDKRNSADQIKNVIQEKIENVNNEHILGTHVEKKIFYEKISNFNDLIFLCSKHKEIQLKYELETNIRLAKFPN